MATKKKAKKKQVTRKKSAAKKPVRAQAKQTSTRSRKLAAKSKKKATRKKIVSKKPGASRRKARQTSQSSAMPAFSPELGRESGDLQEISRIEEADSESVSELIEEGNAFEADAVAGVESADDSDEQEVHTHEVPEDDVPEEYLEKD